MTFGFFIGAVVLTALVSRPLFQVASLMGAALLYVSLKRCAGWRFIVGVAVVIVVLAFVNGFFNAQGATVLFTYLGGRPYTVEGLAYGASTALMFGGIILWFASYSVVMTSDRFTYLFGGMAPALTLTLTMVLRLVPNYVHRAEKISVARRCIGKSPIEGTLRARIKGAAAVLSSLTTWAFEGAVVMADSMRSRGYGIGKRTTFARYRFTVRDALVAVVFGLTFAGALVFAVTGGASVQYLPNIVMSSLNVLGWMAFGAYVVFMLIPFALDAEEALLWRCSLSKI